MGSTSYDEARDATDPNDPTWSGASWYGPSTGEYWIINPREYADPRKHGPEYQSRARRMAAAGAIDDAVDDAPEGAHIADAAADETPENAPPHAPRSRADARPRRAATMRRGTARPDAPTAGGEATWTFGTAAPAPRTRAPRQPFSPERRGARAPRDAWGAEWSGDARAIRQEARTRRPMPSPRDLVGSAADDPIRRLGVALVAWPPIGLAAAALIGDVTGCASFSAACGGTEPLLPWLAQAAILGLLLLLPPVARLLAGGAIGVLVALVPLTALLVAVGATGAPQAGFALAFLLGIAWLVGVAWAVGRSLRPGRARAAA